MTLAVAMTMCGCSEHQKPTKLEAKDIAGTYCYETHIYDYLVFRTYTSNRVMDMGVREKAEGVYVEKPVCENYRRQHFPGHPAGKADVLRLLAELEEQS